MYNKKFKDMIKNITAKLQTVNSLEKAYNEICNYVNNYYENIVIYFGKEYGKRIEYVTGTKKDSLNFTDKFMISDKYYVFIENFNEMNKQEQQIFLSFLKVVSAVM